AGPLWAVNPKYDAVAGVTCYRNVAGLPQAPQLAVICTPPASVPGLIAELGARGTRAAIVLTAGLGQAVKSGKSSLQQAMLEAARPYLLRVLGPNCLGLLVPGIGLNASFAPSGAHSGRLAFVSQSGALTTAVLDWANRRSIGFSHFISLGDGADVDFGDILDYLVSDPSTDAILLYIESIRHARKFMSAARAAARNKLVLVVKAGRVPEGAQAAASHTGALAGADEVYDAAIRRAGMLRVDTTDELFDAVETLSRARSYATVGERLAIMTNGGGAGVMATDALILGGGKLAHLSEGSLQKLDLLLPPTWSHGNPIDIIGDAPVQRYVDGLQVLLQADGADAILLIHAPTAIVPSIQIAEALTGLIGSFNRNVFTCWMGGTTVQPARDLCRSAGIPTYDTPEQAVRAFLQVTRYRRNQHMLMQTPPSITAGFNPDRAAAQRVLQLALEQGRSMLTEPESKQVLALYGIPVVQTRSAGSAEEAQQVASELGFPIALKILSPDISHKSDVGGVVLDLETQQQVQEAADAMLRRLAQAQPQARLEGFSVQQMARRPQAFELIVGATTDRVFGPVILFGQGGTAVEVIADRALALPPLNRHLAQELVARTRIARLLAGYRNRPPIDHEALYTVLVRISQLLCDLPQVTELDINPLFADEHGVLALDARIGVAASALTGTERLAIRPYPQELEETIEWGSQTLLLRPIRPEDEPQHSRFFEALSTEDVRLRFFSILRQPVHNQLARMTQIDYDREMAFIAVGSDAEHGEMTLGVVRAIADPDNETAEFAVIVRSDLKQRGLGAILMRKIIAYCRARGTQRLVGQVLPDNTGMLKLARTCGFEVGPVDTDGIELTLPLQTK
ncbi:MAG: bifunctional acetate--CoA ligase family protein/GNAT family N-acetyltransferase, partial [Herbaspirillum sp.]